MTVKDIYNEASKGYSTQHCRHPENLTRFRSLISYFFVP